MSETEHYTGELIKIPKTSSVEDMCKQICQESGMLETGYYETWREALEYDFDKDYFIYDDVIYKVDLVENDPYDDIFRASKSCNGRIKFEVKYYNGGCCFSEALKEALKGIE